MSHGGNDELKEKELEEEECKWSVEDRGYEFYEEYKCECSNHKAIPDVVDNIMFNIIYDEYLGLARSCIEYYLFDHPSEVPDWNTEDNDEI
jgi:hypothetical protein